MIFNSQLGRTCMKRLGLLTTLLLSMSAANAASILPNLTYFLNDHPDGNLTDVLNGITYGLRLDDPIFSMAGSGGDGSNGAKTFSTTQETASVSLFWDNMGDMNDANDIVTITGQLSRNSDNSIWDVTYTLTDITSMTDGFAAATASGTLSNGGDVFTLTGEQNTSGYVFLALGDGHRLDNDTTSEVARGWLLPNGPTEDWLVTLTPVPVPAALPLLLSGVLGISLFSRKRKSI